jgi:hypothetical protein
VGLQSAKLYVLVLFLLLKVVWIYRWFPRSSLDVWALGWRPHRPRTSWTSSATSRRRRAAHCPTSWPTESPKSQTEISGLPFYIFFTYIFIYFICNSKSLSSLFCFSDCQKMFRHFSVQNTAERPSSQIVSE